MVWVEFQGNRGCLCRFSTITILEIVCENYFVHQTPFRQRGATGGARSFYIPLRYRCKLFSVHQPFVNWNLRFFTAHVNIAWLPWQKLLRAIIIIRHLVKTRNEKGLAHGVGRQPTSSWKYRALTPRPSQAWWARGPKEVNICSASTDEEDVNIEHCYCEVIPGALAYPAPQDRF